MYVPGVTTSNHHSLLHWFLDNLVWDTAGNANSGFLKVVWATRKLLISSALAVLMTLRDCGQVTAPELLLLALVHIIFAVGALALLVYTLQRFTRAMKTR
jgi:hypothetical protein